MLLGHMPVLLAQLSDTHVVADGTDEVLYVDNNARAAMAVDAICVEAPSVAAVLATGDLTQWGTDAEYDKLAEVLAPLPLGRMGRRERSLAGDQR